MLSAVVLPERGAMNAVMVSSQDANRAGPRPEGRLRSPSSSPVSAAGSDRGSAPASDGRSLMAVLAAGTGVSGVICGLPASAATGSPGLRDARGDDPPRDDPGRDDRARQHDGDQRDQDGGRAGPRLAGTPAGQADDPPFAERGNVPARQRCGDPGSEPGQPGRGGQAPADQQHDPDPGAVAGQDRHPRGVLARLTARSGSGRGAGSGAARCVGHTGGAAAALRATARDTRGRVRPPGRRGMRWRPGGLALPRARPGPPSLRTTPMRGAGPSAVPRCRRTGR